GRRVRGRVLRVDVDQRLRDDRGRTQAREPLVVRGQHVPGRPFRAGLAEHRGVGMLVFVPVLAFTDVAGGELPVLLRPVDPAQETGPLLFPGQVEEHLDDPDAVVGQVAFPVVDLPVAARPDVAGAALRRQFLAVEDLPVHPGDEHLLVVGTVEDADLAARGQGPGVPPQVVVPEFNRGWLLEAGHPDALRVHPAQYVPDRTVLAGRVEGLKDDQYPVGALRGQSVLVFGQLLHALAEQVLPVLLLADTEPCSGIEVPGQVDTRPWLHPQRTDQVLDPASVLFGHPRSFRFRPRGPGRRLSRSCPGSGRSWSMWRIRSRSGGRWSRPTSCPGGSPGHPGPAASPSTPATAGWSCRMTWRLRRRLA